MATNKLGLKGTLNLAPKVDIKKTDKDVTSTEKAVKKIHSSQGDNVRVTIDFPRDLHKEVKKKVANDELSIRDYVLQLIQRDLSI